MPFVPISIFALKIFICPKILQYVYACSESYILKVNMDILREFLGFLHFHIKNKNVRLPGLHTRNKLIPQMFLFTVILKEYSPALKYSSLFMYLSPTNALLYYTYKMLKYTVKISHDCSYMFRSIWTIIREPMPNLAKVTILCRYSVKIRR